MHGQAYLADTELGRQLGDDDRVKVVCARSSKVADRARPLTVR